MSVYPDAYAHIYQKMEGFKIRIYAPNNVLLEGYLSLKPSTRSTYDIAMRDATIDGLITMDKIEELVSKDESIKGIFCVPVYSNPDGYVYSNETVLRFAKLKPKAKDFKIFWDNAYMLHHFTDEEVKIPNLLEEAKKYGNEDMVYMFFSTSKINTIGCSSV